MTKIMKKLRYIKVTDVIAPFLFLIVLPISVVFRVINKMKKRTLWLICEDGLTARDNGYHFFKYIRQKHNKDFCFYVIRKSEKDYEKVKMYGNIIEFKSLRHWLYYLSADYNISIHKHGNPCQSFFFILHVILHMYGNRVFLQHGITKDDSPWLYYKNTRFKYFICAAKREYEYVKLKFGYPKENVVYTGFPRFDNLYNFKVKANQILIMPTWRNWMGGNYFGEKEFKETEYYKLWNNFLKNRYFIEFIEKNSIDVFFYPHQHMQKFIHLFESKSNRIRIVDNSKKDIQELLKESQLLITDYSSVYMDFAYMKKPIIYYQFDYEMYRENQLQEGYFSYKNDGFGPIVYNENEIIEKIMYFYKKNYKVDDIYINRMEKFFEVHDNKNNERVYKTLKGENL